VDVRRELVLYIIKAILVRCIVTGVLQSSYFTKVV
jgi:hypothetical protein